MELNVAMNIDTTKYLVSGAGITGLSVVKYLSSREKDLRIMDTRTIPPNAKHIEELLPSSQIKFGRLDSQWLAEAEEAEIANVLWQYGEERNSRRIARHLVQQRQEKPITTTKQLADLVAQASPKFDRHKHQRLRVLPGVPENSRQTPRLRKRSAQ